MTDQHIEHLTEIIQNRKSVYPKQFTGETIEKDVVKWIMHNAIKAPSHRKVNPWRFHVFSGEKKQEIAQLFQRSYKENTAPEQFSEEKWNSFDEKFSASSHLIIISMKPNAERPVPEWENVASVAMAVQNIYLSVTAAGFGGYWSSPASLLPVLKNYLQLADDETCLGLFYLGVPIENLPPAVGKGHSLDYVTWHQ